MYLLTGVFAIAVLSLFTQLSISLSRDPLCLGRCLVLLVASPRRGIGRSCPTSRPHCNLKYSKSVHCGSHQESHNQA
jgi:hypothetical protein